MAGKMIYMYDHLFFLLTGHWIKLFPQSARYECVSLLHTQLEFYISIFLTRPRSCDHTHVSPSSFFTEAKLFAETRNRSDKRPKIRVRFLRRTLSG